jgi:hypothetical protein
MSNTILRAFVSDEAKQKNFKGLIKVAAHS